MPELMIGNTMLIDRRGVYQDKIKKEEKIENETSSSVEGGGSIGESKRREANKTWVGIVGLSTSFLTSPKKVY
jgi:hypothetical protein